MNAVILTGSYGNINLPLANYYPKTAFPLGNKTLLEHLLRFLVINGVDRVVIVMPEYMGFSEAVIEKIRGCRMPGIEISFFEERHPRGTAGVLKDLRAHIDSEEFFVISPNVFAEGISLYDVYSFHRRHSSALTVLAEGREVEPGELENMVVDRDGQVKRFHILHHSRDNRRQLRPSGIYLFSRHVLDSIPDDGYMDIKEQLVPLLNARGIKTRAFVLDRPLGRIDTASDYLNLMREYLSGGALEREKGLSHGPGTGLNVWFGNNVRVSPSAYILGPVFIGDGCQIGDNSRIIGPATIGKGSVIGRNALVRESVLFDNTMVDEGSSVEYSIIGYGCTAGGEPMKGAVVVGSEDGEVCNIMRLHDKDDFRYMFESDSRRLIGAAGLKRGAYLAAKRVMDLSLSLVGLIVLLPVFAAIAIAIRLDSPGGITFSQRRCGKDGREFKMYKFRTMVMDADATHHLYIGKKDIDGPMFKMNDDPRITKVGRFLRATSLDELPQLWNILLGDMSIVGPRPLVMEEMQFAPHWRDIRLRVKPGMTGLWQISGRSNVSFHEWIRCDITYVKNQSLGLDVKIFLDTFKSVLMGTGAK